MKLVLVTHFYPAHGGGVELVSQQLAKRLAADHSCELTWCASDTDPAPDFPGLIALPMRAWNVVERMTGMPYPLWGPASLARLARAIRQADAVHVHDCIYFGSLIAATLARWHGKRLLVTQHIGEVPLRNLLLRLLLAAANRIGGRLVLARADAVVFISLVVKAYYERMFGARQTFHYLPNGVDTALFNPGVLPKSAYREQLGFATDRVLLLFVGRFVNKKGLPTVRALAAAQPDWQWCLIGQGPEDPHAWGLANVAVCGPLPHRALPDYYRAADLLVLPSESEGFPLVVQEAMACGLVPCIREAIAAGGGLPEDLWAPLPPNGMAASDECVAAERAIECALQRSPQAHAAWREGVAGHALAYWSWEATARWLAKRMRGPGG